LQSSIANPTFGQSVTLTATVTRVNGLGAPTGSVTFMDGSQKLGTVPLSGESAKFNTALLGPGTHTLTAIYGGSSQFDGSTSSPLTLKVNAAATRVTLTSSADPAVFGQPVIFTAKVSVVAPGVAALGGTVTFKDGATVLGTEIVSNGHARLITSKLSVGSHAITAVFQASSVDLAKSTSTALTQTIDRAATKLTVSSSAAAVILGQAITLTAKVSVLAPGVALPSGIVTIKDGTTVLGTAVVTNGVAVFKMPKLAKGKYTLTVVYGGDAHCLSCASASLTESIV
jgi:large repetitive protein